MNENDNDKIAIVETKKEDETVLIPDVVFVPVGYDKGHVEYRSMDK